MSSPAASTASTNAASAARFAMSGSTDHSRTSSRPSRIAHAVLRDAQLEPVGVDLQTRAVLAAQHARGRECADRAAREAQHGRGRGIDVGFGVGELPAGHRAHPRHLAGEQSREIEHVHGLLDDLTAGQPPLRPPRDRRHSSSHDPRTRRISRPASSRCACRTVSAYRQWWPTAVIVPARPTAAATRSASPHPVPSGFSTNIGETVRHDGLLDRRRARKAARTRTRRPARPRAAGHAGHAVAAERGGEALGPARQRVGDRNQPHACELPQHLGVPGRDTTGAHEPDPAVRHCSSLRERMPVLRARPGKRLRNARTGNFPCRSGDLLGDRKGRFDGRSPALPAAVADWLTQRSYRATEWRARGLAARKGDQRVSVVIPARDEEATIGAIVATVRHSLMDDAPTGR